jgi:gliding motility-associated-like protein
MFTNFSSRLVCLFLLVCSCRLDAQSGQFFLRDTFCSNQSILVGNQFFGPSNPTGQVVLPGAAFNGADSIINVELTFNQPVVFNLTQTLCVGDTLRVNGTPYHANFYLGQEVVQEGSVNGCDSIINVNLTFQPVVFVLDIDLCEGDTVYVNGTAYDAFVRKSGVEVIPNGACDSILQVTIHALTPPFSNLRDTLCPDDFLIINGNRYDTDNRAGYEILPNAASNGCDSIVAIDLEFRNLWVYIGEDREIVKGDTVCITPQYGLNAISEVWIPSPPCPDSACAINCVQLLENSTFILVATDVSGCVLQDELTIKISNKNRIYAPNVFSPDARWPNNYFYLNCDRAIVNIKRMFIADRWGELIYDRENIPPNLPDEGWDGYFRGKVMNPDTYIFWAELERFDGTTIIEKGGFSLVR